MDKAGVSSKAACPAGDSGWRLVLMLSAAALLSACASKGKPVAKPSPPTLPGAMATVPSSTSAQANGGAYYLDDGPDARPPADLDKVADARPRVEPLHRFANRPYTVLGQSFVPMTELGPFRELGHGSWYGRRFHGKPTSSGEPYDMYAMTAAHPTLPIPSYARVKNVSNGRSVVVRVNDRGPFLRGRIIDLSYTAAYKLGYVNAGSAQLEVELILPAEYADAAVRRSAGVSSASPVVEHVGLVPELASASAGVFLQLGAFSSRHNAEAFKASVAADITSHQVGVELLRDGEHFRLHAGPYPSVEDARRAASRLGSRLQVKPFVVVR